MKTSDLKRQLTKFDRKGIWLFTPSMLRIMFSQESEEALKVSVGRQVSQGNLQRVTHGLYANPEATSKPAHFALESLIAYLRPDDFSYLSGETVLSESGVISQMPSLLVVMTTGKKKTIKTAFGDIEFIHTDCPVSELKANTIYDAGRGCFVATLDRAYDDLRKMRRSLDLVDQDELAERKAEGNL